MPRPTKPGPASAGAPAPESADSTRARIVAAAMEEFALHGIAGARVDRIAKRARTSKERVYVYFRGKEALYAHVAATELARFSEATPLDPLDLPGYASQIFDHLTDRPDHYRLIAWGRLELGHSPAADPESMQTPLSGKLDRLRQAQAAGQLTSAWDPVDILALVNQIAATWAAQPEIASTAAGAATDPSTAARRAAVVNAVELLFPRAHASEPTSAPNS